MNYTFKILLHQFKTQVTKSQIKSWITVLDTTQSTANAIKLQTVNIVGTSQNKNYIWPNYNTLTKCCNPKTIFMHGLNQSRWEKLWGNKHVWFTVSVTYFAAYLYSVGMKNRNLHQLVMTNSRVVYCIPRAKLTWLPELMQINMGKKWRLMDQDGRNFTEQGKNSWQWVKHAQLYPDPLQALKWRTHLSSGFSEEGPLICASAVHHCHCGLYEYKMTHGYMCLRNMILLIAIKKKNYT